jgi:hypothetical protein
MLAKEGYDNSFKDTKDIENYQRKLIVLMDVFMAW